MSLMRYLLEMVEPLNFFICRSVKDHGTTLRMVPVCPPIQHFVRTEILPSGHLIRPCEGGGPIIHIFDHIDLEPWSVPEVTCPPYEKSTLLAQKTTMAALHQLRQISHEVSQPTIT